MLDYKTVSNLRILLHKHFYIDINIISDLMNGISKEFDLFDINYDICTNIIQLKIKKTNIRKSNDYSHTASYYYNTFNEILLSLFVSRKALLFNLISAHKEEYNFNGGELEALININTINAFYGITTIGDNIVVIHL